MCKVCKGKVKNCPCRGKITTSDGNKPRYSKNNRVTNQKGGFGKK